MIRALTRRRLVVRTLAHIACSAINNVTLVLVSGKIIIVQSLGPTTANPSGSSPCAVSNVQVWRRGGERPLFLFFGRCGAGSNSRPNHRWVDHHPKWTPKVTTSHIEDALEVSLSSAESPLSLKNQLIKYRARAIHIRMVAKRRMDD